MALIVSTVLGPPAAWLRSKGWPAGWLAAAVVVLGFIGVVVGIIAILTPQVAGQAGEVAAGASDGLQKIRDWVTGEPLNLSDGQITRAIEAVQDKLTSSASAISSGVFSTIGTATSVIVNLVLVLMLTFFFVKDGHKFLPWVKTLGGQRAGVHLVEVLRARLGHARRLHPHADAGRADRRRHHRRRPRDPRLAPGRAARRRDLLRRLHPDHRRVRQRRPRRARHARHERHQRRADRPGHRGRVQQLEGNVLSPWLQGKNMNLHPAVVLLSVTAGGSLFGITGAFLAVPVVATIAEILRYLNERIDDSVSVLAPKEDSDSAETLAED